MGLWKAVAEVFPAAQHQRCRHRAHRSPAAALRWCSSWSSPPRNGVLVEREETAAA
uniref:hypothetical protein n=1 Tax=Streptomyces filipinensis TaxID=66887 RepID=UPI0035716A00